MNTNRRSRGPILFLLLCLSALPLFAQAPPAFLIERIDVRNVRRASPQVVRSESLLREGQAYTEQQLQDAQSRIRRLPFVLDVEFSLEKGSQRDVYVLVMDVDEASPFFVGVDHNTYFFDGAGRDSSDQTAASAGLRWFTGDYGQLHANVTRALDDGGNAQLGLGYTQYNLLGRAIFLSASVETSIEEYAGDAWRLQSVLGIPVRGNHAVRLELNGYRSEFEVRGPTPEISGTSEVQSALLSASWIYDSTNDALFPTDGSYLLAGGGYGHSEISGPSIILPGGGPSIERDESSDYVALNLATRKFWPVRELDAISLQATGQLAETSRDFFEDVQTTSLGATATYSGSLWGLERTRRHGDLRWEAGVRGSWWRTESPMFGGDRDYSQYELVTGLAHRNRWGLFRINVGWQLDVQSTQGPVLP